RLATIRTGNLAFGSGCLVVATARELAIYSSASRELEHRKQEATAHPQQAAARYRLAMAEADAGLAQAALADFARPEQLAGPDERMERMSLRQLAQSRRHGLLLDLAEKGQVEQHVQEARRFLWQAAAAEFPVAARLRGLARLGEDSYLTQPGDRVEVGQAI